MKTKSNEKYNSAMRYLTGRFATFAALNLQTRLPCYRGRWFSITRLIITCMIVLCTGSCHNVSGKLDYENI